MAVDTRQKRFSMLNFGSGAHLHATFEADGSVDADDRLHLLDLYSGIAAALPSISPICNFDLRSTVVPDTIDLLSTIASAATDLLSTITQPFDLRSNVASGTTDRRSTIDDAPTDLDGDLC